MKNHIENQHANEPRVRDALKKPPKERNNLFTEFRKEGIKIYNMQEIKKDNPVLQRERKEKNDSTMYSLKMCENCNGFFKGKYISRHQKNCQLNSSKPLSSMPVTLLKPIDSGIRITDDFKKHIICLLYTSDAADD